MSCSKIFNDMQQANLPEHLVDHIANKVHRIFTKDTLQKINTMYSPFEKIFMESEDVFETLKKLYPDMTVHVDNYIDWITVVLKLTATKFVVWHSYMEYMEANTFLMEGEVDEKENVYTFNKFIYMNNGSCRGWLCRCGHSETIEDAEQYHQKKFKSMIPFQFLHFCMKNDYCMEKIVYKNAANHGKWILPIKIINSFDNYDWGDYIPEI